VTSGALPAGLTFAQSSTGAAPTDAYVVSGVLTAAAVTSAFVVTVTDSASATASLTFTIVVTPLTVTTPSTLPAGSVGAPYSQTLAAGYAGTYQQASAPSWSLTLGALPPGLALSSSGAITGIPTAAGTAVFTATVADANSATASQAFTLAINFAALVVATASALPSGTAGAAYSQTLSAAGGVPPYQWQVTSGSLPPLLALSSGGVIAGTPTTPGAWSFTVSVTDSSLHLVSQTFSLDVTLGPLTVTSPATLPPAIAGSAYSQSLTASGGAPPYSWQVVSGSWPAGLVFSTSGAISGTPTTAGSYAFSARVSDSAGETATQSFGLTVAAAGSLSRVGVIPQMAVGGGWVTTLCLVNRGSEPVQASVVLHSDNGGAWTLPATVTQGNSVQQVSGSTFNATLNPNSPLTIVSEPQAETVEGWADVLASGSLGGYAVYSDGTAEASAPLETALGKSISLVFDNTNGNAMGIALVNLDNAQAALTATIWDENGNLITTVPVALTLVDANGLGHDSFMLAQRIAATALIRGVIQFTGNAASGQTAAGQIAGLGLTVSASGLFTSIQTMTP
jgi:hypothetical protein